MRATFLYSLVSSLFVVGGCAAEDQTAIGSPPPPATAPSYRSSLLSLHRSLVEINSITGGEYDVGNFLVNYLEDLGYTVNRFFVPPNNDTVPEATRFNIFAWPSSSKNHSSRVLVSSHIDTVPPYIPYGISADPPQSDTVISGRGSVDAKASIAAQITAVQELLFSSSIRKEDVALLFVVGEETTGDGMRSFSATLPSLDPPPHFGAAIFGEPTENRLACGHKGHGMCVVTAKGKAGHSGYPWLGKSATEVLIRALAEILDADLGSSERFGNTTVNVGIIAGGVASNVIPESAMAQLALRVAIGPQETGASAVIGRIQEILDQVDEEAFTMSCVNGYGAVTCDCDVEGFDTVVVNYGTDIPNFKGEGKRYLYGPGTIFVAHSDHEALTVGDLEEAVEGYKKLILHALGSSPESKTEGHWPAEL